MRERVILTKEVKMGGGGGGSQVQYEPVKSAEQSMKDAADEVARAQEMRRGITSTFNRKTMAGAAASPATAGTAAKLGA